jgi:non-canonical (house-cleaning) NTP pyrophosphatase
MIWNPKILSATDDVQEAREMREEATEQIETISNRSGYVSKLTSQLIARRVLNHFGDDIEITFRPKGTNR